MSELREGEAESGRIVFEFGPEDVVSCSGSRGVGWDKSYHTEFDRLLLGRWEQAMRDGVFRYDLKEVVSRTIPGQYGIVALNNPKRFSHRRPPGDMQTLVQPFDPSQFNFNKVQEKEVLFEVRRRSRRRKDRQDMGEVMTESSLELCLELVSLSGHSGFCMVANSLLAYASVNHLHYHFLYTDHSLLPAKTLGGREVSRARGSFELVGHYVRGFGFQMDSDPQTCARAIFKVVSLLLESGIPYNISMLRGPAFSNPSPTNPPHPPPPSSSSSSSLVRTILIPRKPVLGFKQLYQREGPPPPFFAASCELALGLIPIMDREKYATITEDEIVMRLREQELSTEEFSALVDKLCSYSETES